MNNTKNQKKFIRITIIVLIGFIFEPLMSIGFATYLRLTGVKTIGKITSYEMVKENQKGKVHYTYSPIVSFKLNNTNITAIASLNNSATQFDNIDEKVTVYYDKNNPENIMIDNVFSAYIDNLIKVLARMSIVLLFIVVLPLMSKNSNLTMDVPLKNRVISLLICTIPTAAAILWLIEYLFTYDINNNLFLYISVVIILIYINVLFKFLISLKNKN